MADLPEVLVMQGGLLVDKEKYLELEGHFRGIHAELTNGRAREQVNLQNRVYLNKFRKLFWPQISWKSFNSGMQGVYHAKFHSIREQITEG